MLALIVALGAAVLAHIAPFPFLLDATDETVWRMPRTTTPTVYLTFDDGPNPSATPQLLDVLARHGVTATLFVIDKHIMRETAPIVPGDVIVIHDGHHKNPRLDRRYAVETVDRLILELRKRGLQFGRICP